MDKRIICLLGQAKSYCMLSALLRSKNYLISAKKCVDKAKTINDKNNKQTESINIIDFPKKVA
jgi:hypothetical protein